MAGKSTCFLPLVHVPLEEESAVRFYEIITLLSNLLKSTLNGVSPINPSNTVLLTLNQGQHFEFKLSHGTFYRTR